MSVRALPAEGARTYRFPAYPCMQLVCNGRFLANSPASHPHPPPRTYLILSGEWGWNSTGRRAEPLGTRLLSRLHVYRACFFLLFRNGMAGEKTEADEVFLISTLNACSEFAAEPN